MRRLSTLLLAFCAFVQASAAPECLVVQVKELKGVDAEAHVSVDHDLAASLDQEGRVFPFVWSMADPLFRAMSEAEKLIGTDKPTEESVLDFAARNKVPYVIILTAYKKENRIWADLKLFKGKGRTPVWTDHQEQSVVINGQLNLISLKETIARTWTIKLGEGPFKALPARNKVSGTDASPGAGAQAGVADVAVPKPLTGNPQLISQGQAMLSEGRLSDAISLLRSAVDGAPLDMNLRRVLIDAYLSQRMFELAADEALRAANLSDSPGMMLLLAARAYVGMGEPVRAKEALNQALARDASGHVASVLRGEIALLSGQYAEAVTAYSEALQTKDSTDARMGRAMAYAFSGDSEKAQADYKLIPEMAPAQKAEFYVRSMEHMNRRFDELVKDIRTIMQEGTVSPKNPTIQRRALVLDQTTASLAKFLEGMSPPPKFIGSHEKRRLAHSLLLQASSEAIKFAQQGGEDLSAELAITLGEAIRRNSAAKATYSEEVNRRS